MKPCGVGATRSFCRQNGVIRLSHYQFVGVPARLTRCVIGALPAMPSARTIALERRQYIFRRVVLDNRRVAVREVMEHFGEREDVSQMVRDDIESFREIGCPLLWEERDKDHGFLRFRDGPHTDDDEPRIAYRAPEKQLAARLAAGVICGFTADPGSEEQMHLKEVLPASRIREALEAATKKADNPEAERAAAFVVKALKLGENGGDNHGAFFSRNEILAQLKRAMVPLKANYERLIRHLESFWHEATRLVYVDAGTTNLYLAQALASLLLPMPRQRLASLTVATNSRRIWAELGPSHIPIKTVIIGGMQKFRSAAVCGALAENFLRRAGLFAGVAIVGATRVDLDRGHAASDSLEEAAVKCLMFDHAALKVLLVTSDKLQTGPGREGYPIVTLDPVSVDVLLTNAPLLKKGDEAKREIGEFAQHVQKLESRGLPVLVATEPGVTIPWPM